MGNTVFTARVLRYDREHHSVTFETRTEAEAYALGCTVDQGFSVELWYGTPLRPLITCWAEIS
jgi:hypothetical protein